MQVKLRISEFMCDFVCIINLIIMYEKLSCDVLCCVYGILHNFMYVYYRKNFSCKRDGQITRKLINTALVLHVDRTSPETMHTKHLGLNYWTLTPLIIIPFTPPHILSGRRTQTYFAKYKGWVMVKGTQHAAQWSYRSIIFKIN